MTQRTLINEKWLKEFSPYPLNYNMKEIQNYVKLAEVIWIEPILGSDFYEELLEQTNAPSGGTLTEENSTALVEAIYPYLGFAVALEALPMTWAHISEVGITKGHSDNSDSLDQKEMTYVSQHLRAQVEARKDYCKKWLCERQDYYPLLDCCGCGCSCCQSNARLNAPNPMYEIYSTRRKNTSLR